MSNCINSKYVKEYTYEDALREEEQSINVDSIARTWIRSLNDTLLYERGQLKKRRYRHHGFLWLQKEPCEPCIRFSSEFLRGYVSDPIIYRHLWKKIANNICEIVKKEYKNQGWKVVYKNRIVRIPGGYEADYEYLKTKFHFYIVEPK